MKKYIFISLLASLGLLSCQEKTPSISEVIAANDLDQLRSTRAALGDQHQALSRELEALDRAISKLDQSEKLSLVSAMGEHYIHNANAIIATSHTITFYRDQL